MERGDPARLIGDELGGLPFKVVECGSPQVVVILAHTGTDWGMGPGIPHHIL